MLYGQFVSVVLGTGFGVFNRTCGMRFVVRKDVGGVAVVMGKPAIESTGEYHSSHNPKRKLAASTQHTKPCDGLQAGAA